MSHSTWEKFEAATLSLARSGPIKDRLSDAYRNYLADVGEDELPSELRADFRAFSCALRREQPLLRGEDSVRATIRKMSNDEADRMASSVVRMFGALPRNAAQGPRAARGQVVPLFLLEA